MDSRKTGELIASIRKEKKMTQKEIADLLGISDKTISKWERGNGCPDISLIQELADILQIDISSILEGELSTNPRSNGNMKKTRFYVCPICDNVITSINDIALSCCGKQLEELDIKQDKQHKIVHQMIEDDLYITMEHAMTKEHYISFIAYTTGDKLYFNKLYPEQEAAVYFKYRGHGSIYLYCKKEGLFSKKI